MADVRLGLSWMDTPAFAAAALPLLSAGAIDALEWSFDTAWNPSRETAAVLDAFAEQGRLYGHGVTLSILSAGWTDRQRAWLEQLAAEVARRPYVHVSEHVGFVTTADRIDGAPLPIPLRDDVVAIGVERLRALQTAAGVAVGLENLALALSPRDVDEEGALLEALLAPVDGFLLLDLHNLWCRAENYGRDPIELLGQYPLSRVREIHVAGGKDDDGFRRDTHDHAIPAPVVSLLEAAIARCAHLELVVVERLSMGLTPEALAADVHTVRAVLDA